VKALVISGGGSKGAFAGGVAEFLIKECEKKYDLYLGTSTGSLLIPLLSIGKIDKLKEIYTTVTQTDIFDSCPFIIKKEKGEYKTRINHWGNLWMFLKGKKTFGESNNLRKLICKIVKEEDFEEMKSATADVIVTVSNLTSNAVEYKSLKDCSYHDFCDWIWASANVVPFMSLLEKDGFEYADGGIGNVIPLHHAIYKGACDIDVIVLKTKTDMTKNPPILNALELTMRVFNFMLQQISADDIIIGNLEGLQNKVNLNFYFCPEILTNNSLIFDPEQMKRWWEQGFRHAKENSPLCKCIPAA